MDIKLQSLCNLLPGVFEILVFIIFEVWIRIAKCGDRKVYKSIGEDNGWSEIGLSRMIRYINSAST